MTDRTLTNRLPATWRDFTAFLRRPNLSAPSGLQSGWRALAAMIALSLIGLALLMPLLAGWQSLTGVSGPDAFGKFPPQYLIPIVVLFAPVLEEMLFRGWLSGRPRALWLLGCTVGCCLGITALGSANPLAAVLLLAALPIAASGWFTLRKRATAAWFTRRFPAIFYAVAAVFALSHTLNFSQASPLVLPLVLPQLWSALTLGYIRTRIGLPASILAHVAANGTALSLALVAG